MNKEEIEHKLEQAKKDERIINDNIIKLLEQLAEAEKPKLRHGDFGLWKTWPEYEQEFGIYVNNSAIDDTILFKGSRYCSIASKTDGREMIVFGNIFDLMKDWGEDLKEFEMKAPATNVVVKQRPTFIAFIDANDGNEINVSNEKIEEFWRKLGQMIMTLKRKQS